MTQLLRRSWLALVCAVFSCTALAQNTATPGVTDTEILLGQSCQLSDPLEGITREVRQGASLYFDHINAKGGVHGRKIRVLALDDGYDPKRAEANTRHFIEEARALALFQYAGTPPALAGMALAEKTGVPLIAPYPAPKSCASLIQAMESMQINLGGYPIRLSPRQHSSGRFVDLLMLSKDGTFTR